MCFGAAFIASNNSASFKVRRIYLTQHPQGEISIEISPVDDKKLNTIVEADQVNFDEEGATNSDTLHQTQSEDASPDQHT